jgi:hypothetical protein
MAKLRTMHFIAAVLLWILGIGVTHLIAQFNPSTVTETTVSPAPVARNIAPDQPSSYLAPSMGTDITDENLNVRLIGRWSTGPCRTVAATEINSLVYFGRGSWLEIVDFSNPLEPTLMGKLLLPAPPLDILVKTPYAFVATGSAGLQIIDITNPYQPALLSFLSTPGIAQGLEMASNGSYLYLAAGDSGLLVIDFTNPYSPQIAGSIKLPGGAFSVARHSESRVLVASGSGGLRVVDVSIPGDPGEKGFFLTPHNALDLAVNTTHAFVALGEAGIMVLDISRPDQPDSIATLKTAGYARKIHIYGEYAYVAAGEAGLRVISIFEPSRIREISHVDTDGFTYEIFATRYNIYLADGSNGIRQINVYDHSNPQESSYFLTGSQVRGLSISGNQAYLATGSSGLTIVDISRPTQPQEAGALRLPGFAEDIALHDHYAYFTLLGKGLQAVDIAVPSAPKIAGDWNQNMHSNRITIADTLAFVSDLQLGLQVIDISNPARPHAIGHFDVGGKAQGIAWHHNKLFLAAVNGLHIIDVTNPRQPFAAGFLPNPGISVATDDSYAYLGTATGGVQIIDLSNPSAPTVVSSFGIPDTVQELTVHGKYLYAAGTRAGLRVIDVFDPLHPQEAGYFRTNDRAYDLILDHQYIYLTDQNDGLYILEFVGTTGNVPPDAPTLLAPANGSHLANPRPQLSWQIPVDANDDRLHFRLELNQDRNWQPVDRLYDSRKRPEMFLPPPPVVQGSGTMSLTPDSSLSDGDWFWRGQAWDGLSDSPRSETWHFVVDTHAPIIRELVFSNPGYGANWYNPAHDTIVSVIVFYDELHPQSLSLTSSLFPDTLRSTSLNAGTNQSAAFSFSLETKNDGSYPLFSALIDSAGQPASRADTIKLDQSPPTGYFSDAPDTMMAGEIYTVHVLGATDGAGCGIRQIYLDAFGAPGGNPTTPRDSLIGITEPGIYLYRYFAVDHLNNRGIIRTDTTVVLPPPTRVPIFPALTADTIAAGESFWVDIQIGTEQEPVAHLFSASFILNFSNTEYIDVAAADSILPGDLFGTNVSLSAQVDDNSGKITVNISQANNTGGVDGFGRVARIKFRTRDEAPDGTLVEFAIAEASAHDALGFPITLIPGQASLWLVRPLSDFAMSVTPQFQTIYPGDSTFFKLSFWPIGAFQAPLQLTVIGLPPGMQARFPTQPFAIPDSFQMVITTTDDLLPANYPLIIQASGANMVHADTVTIRVLTPSLPDFVMRVVPDSQTIRQGESATFRASFEPSGGFAASIQLETSTLPPGMSVDLPAAAFSIPAAFDLTFTTAGTIAAGRYEITLIASGGGIRHHQQIYIHILPRPDFIMTIIPDSQAVIAGGRISYQISFEPIGGFDAPLILSVAVTGGIEATHTTRPFDIPLTLEVSFFVPRNVPPGVYYPVVTATGGGITHEVTLAILVLPPDTSFPLLFDVQPNPFTPNGDGYNDQAIFRLPESTTAGISILIFDLKSRKITTLREQATWDGRDEQGQVVLPGAYIFVVQRGTTVISKGVIYVAR